MLCIDVRIITLEVFPERNSKVYVLGGFDLQQSQVSDIFNQFSSHIK